MDKRSAGTIILIFINIGIGSLASAEKKIFRTNTLKVLEYMAKGLPVVCTEGEVGMPASSRYRLNVKPENYVDTIEQIIEFYDYVYSANSDEIINDIRVLCKKCCSPEIGLKGVLEVLKK